MTTNDTIYQTLAELAVLDMQIAAHRQALARLDEIAAKLEEVKAEWNSKTYTEI